MTQTRRYVATCPKGVEQILAEELRAIGAADARESVAAASFTGPLELAYRVCLWSRLASRVLMELAEFPAASAEQLYEGVYAVPWEEHISPERTLAVNANGTTAGITHTGFAARKVKDAVVDRVREQVGERPSVDLERPDVRLNLRLRNERAILSLDLSGEPLHRRGYRTPGEQVEAPLKENLAAAILVRAGWPQAAAKGASLLDPMCGSGTLLIEAAAMATDRAPGLLRDRWGFLGWLGHDTEAWDALIDEADTRAEDGAAALPLIAGWDSDGAAVEMARKCVAGAGFANRVSVDVRSLDEFAPPDGAVAGLVVTNPPYGVRLGKTSELASLYAQFGQQLRDGFEGWRAALFTAEDELARATGLRSEKAYKLYNGAVATKLYLFDVSPAKVRSEVKRASEGEASQQERAPGLEPSTSYKPSAGGEMFANRVGKNLRHIGKWARRQGITCFRVYDADLPEYAVAIDLYQGAGGSEGRRFAHVQEYAPPASIDPAKAEQRLTDIMAILPEALGVHSGDISLKVRKRQRGTSQYERQERRGEFIEVEEGALRFLVNLYDYLDTGLFLDHRPARERLRELAPHKRFLNLFAYTGTGSVYAAAGGAMSTTTVDMSATYLDWARRNMALNGFEESAKYRLVRADALTWIAEEGERVGAGDSESYDLIFLDPPTFSNSKRMGGGTFDVQRDHAELLRATVSLLAPEGLLLFSNNLKRFRLDSSAVHHFDIDDITARTIPKDFERSPRIHHCFEVRVRTDASREVEKASGEA